MPWYCWRSPPGWSFVAMCPDPTSALFSGGTLTGAAAKHPSVGVQNVLISGRGAGYAVTSIRICRRRVGARSPRISRSVLCGLLAGIRPVADGPASSQRHGARFGGVRMGSAARPEARKPTSGLAGASAWTRASTCTDRDPQGSPPGIRPAKCRVGVRCDPTRRGCLGPYQLRPFVAQN